MISTNKSYYGKPQSLQKVFLKFAKFYENIYTQKNKEEVPCTKRDMKTWLSTLVVNVFSLVIFCKLVGNYYD